MNNPIQRCTISFVVRVWAEYLNQQPPLWRGAIELCDRGEEIPFANLEEMLTLIQEKTIYQLKMEDEK
jgi:hypothetical protein